MLTKVAVTFTSVVLLAAADATALGLREVPLGSALIPPSAGITLRQPLPDSLPQRLAAAESTDTIAVGPSDTLWDIALAVRPDSSVTVQQTMLALQRLNPGAFIAGNINMVRNGEVLRIPDLEEIRSMAVADAINEVSRQNQLFDNRQNVPLVAQAVATQPNPDSNAALNRGELRVVSSDDSAPDTAQANDAVGVRTAEFDARINSLEDQLAVQAEEVDRVALQNQELSARLSMLEEQIASAQEIIRLRDLELAQLQQALAAAAAAEQAAQQAAEQVAGNQIGVASAATDPAPIVTMAPERSLPQRLLESIVANTYMLVGVGLLVIVLLVFALLRRGRSVEEEEEVLPGSADASDIKVDGLTPMEEVSREQEPAANDVFDDLGFLDIEVTDEDLAAELEQEEEQSFRSPIDEAASKLDLARAYIEMGDHEGAREILDEVVVEGSPAQAEDARILLGKL